MIGLVMALAAASAEAPAQPMIPAFFTGERLFAICTGEHSGQCWMYVAGVLDGLFLTDYADAERSGCGPTLTNRAAAKRVTSFLSDNPEMRKKAAAVAVKAAMESALSCSAPVAKIEI